MKDNRALTILAASGIGILFVWMLVMWCHKPENQGAGYQVAPPAKPVSNVPKIDAPAPPHIKVIPKKVAKTKLGLPEDVADDDTEEVIDTAEIPPAPNGATTVTVMNTKTGDSKTLVKVKPQPFFAFEKTGAAGIRYGITSNGDQQAAVFARQDILRVMDVHLSVTAEARTVPTKGTSEAAASVEISYRWQ